MELVANWPYYLSKLYQEKAALESEQNKEKSKKEFDDAVANGVIKALEQKAIDDAVAENLANNKKKEAPGIEEQTQEDTDYDDLGEDDLKALCEAREINMGNTKKKSSLIAKLVEYDNAQS